MSRAEPQPGTIRHHIRQHGFRIVTPSAPLVRHWWRRISVEVWDGVLPQPKTIRVRHDRKAWAWLGSDRVGEVDLDIDAYPLPKKRLIEVLAHESVHAYLWIVEGDNKTLHGPAFMRHRHRIKRVLGFTLAKEVAV